MKKMLIAAAMTVASLSFAQISVGVRANLLANTSSPSFASFKNSITNVYTNSIKNSIGFNVGMSLKIDLPVSSFFVMPEIYYSNFNSKFTEPITNTEITAKSNRIDIPALVGYNVLGKTLGVYVGPVASINLNNKDSWNNFTTQDAPKNFTMGYQLGAQAKFRQLVVTARYEGAFSKDTRSFIDKVSSVQVNYDNRPSLFIVGLGYDF